MIYAILDTNILVSALLTKHSDASTVKVFQNTLTGKITPIYNDIIIGEYNDVLKRKKFKFEHQLVDVIIGYILKYGISVDYTPTNIILSDPKDEPIYQAYYVTQNTHNSFLVTGNLKHFPTEPQIISATEFVNFFKL